MLLFCITTPDNKIVFSNLPANFDFMNPKEAITTVFCPVRQCNRRHVLLRVDTFNVYFASYDQNITNRIFKHYLRAIQILLPILTNATGEISKLDLQKSKRLKHNLVNHLTNIHQQLYRLVSQDDLQKSKSNQVEKIEESIKRRPKDAAYIYLRVLKSINFMRTEFDVYEMLNKQNPFLDFNNHSVHRVILLALTPYWVDFLELKIEVNIEPCVQNISIDYKSFSVCLAHIFDNAIKYCAPDTELSISFSNQENCFTINFTMISLVVEEKEFSGIFKENYSGKFAREHNLSGSGIGMFIIRKLIQLNNGNVEFKGNIEPSVSFTLNGIPYCRNQIIISLKK